MLRGTEYISPGNEYIIIYESGVIENYSAKRNVAESTEHQNTARILGGKGGGDPFTMFNLFLAKWYKLQYPHCEVLDMVFDMVLRG